MSDRKLVREYIRLQLVEVNQKIATGKYSIKDIKKMIELGKELESLD